MAGLTGWLGVPVSLRSNREPDAIGGAKEVNIRILVQSGGQP